VGRRPLGRQFGWLWAAYSVSTVGTWLAFDAFPLIAILVLDAGPAAVSALAAAGLAVGAAVAVPLGPWVEFRRKRSVMIAMDLTRCAAVLSVPAAYALGWLTFAQLLVVAVVVAAADIAFKAASGAFVKALVPPGDLLVANARFESTTWTATALGPPLGGVAIGLLGPVTTVLANAASFLLSAAGIRAIGGTEPRPRRIGAPGLRTGDLLDGWRHVLTNPWLRPLLGNTILVNGLILATAPLVAVLMLGELGFAPWQYGLASARPASAAWSAPGWPGRWPRGTARTRSCGWPARCAPAGRSGSRSSSPAPAAWCSSSPSSSAWSPASACSIRSSPRTGWSTPSPTWSPAPWPRGRSAAMSASPR
jgi:MFS family permease